jgi:hypothetical protein
VSIEERLSRRIAIDQDRVVTEGPGQNVTDGAEDSQRVLSEQEGSPVRNWSVKEQRKRGRRTAWAYYLHPCGDGD